MRALFVTGTDTGVGKTTVASAILAAARQRGLRAACLKPLESGCERSAEGALVPVDAMSLWQASGAWQPFETVCPYQFEPAVAPGVAAESRGVTVDFELILNKIRELKAAGPDFALIEGAGGWLVPVGQDRTIADLAAYLGLPVLVVARAGLGTINHSLLTIEAIRRRGLAVTGLVFSDAERTDPEFARSNAHEIKRESGVRALGTLRHLTTSDLGARAAAAEADLALDELLGPTPRR